MKSQSTPKDAIELLIKDHTAVKNLFEIYEGLSDKAVVTKKEVAEAICNELIIHTQIEEEMFYPKVRRAIKDGDRMDEALVEHSAAKDLIAQIQNMNPGDHFYDAKLKVLSEQIEHHIKEEEEDMFPKIRKSGIDLAALGKEMQERKLELKSGELIS